MNTPAKILIVDDEESIRFFLEDLLARDGYQVVAVESGESALASIAHEEFDLALLDLMLEGICGLEVQAALCERGHDTAVVFLTAHASLESAIDALRLGAQDYLLKPCNAASLRESVRAALQKREERRRERALLFHVQKSLAASLEEIRAATTGPVSLEQPPASETDRDATAGVEQGGLVVDLHRRVMALDGHVLELTRTEFDLLACLAKRAPCVVSPQELVRHVQGYECGWHEARDITRHLVHRIRHKAQDCAGSTDLIRNVRGVGYALNGQVSFVPGSVR